VWLDRLEREHDNLRAVLGWAIEKGNAAPGDEAVEIGLRLGGAVQQFWNTRGYATEGREWLGRLLRLNERAVPGTISARTLTRAKALYGAGQLAFFQGDTVTAGTLYRESLSIARSLGARFLVARALQGLGGVAGYIGDFEGSQAYTEQSLAIYRELGARRQIAGVTNNLGVTAREQGDLERAQALLEEGLAIARDLGDDLFAAKPLSVLGTVRMMQGDHAGALALIEEALTITRRLRDPRMEASELCYLATLARYQGDLEAARSLYVESIWLHQASRNQWELVACLVGLGCVWIDLGERDGPCPDTAERYPSEEWLIRGTRLFGVAETLREATGCVIWLHDRADHERCLAVAREALGESAFTAAWAEGRALSPKQACDLALSAE
jgi:tetratricopeptide (TPR) repeat protein